MSGKPNSDGVKKLRLALRDVAWERQQLADSQKSTEEKA